MYVCIILDILHHFRAEVILGAYFEPDQIRRATGLAVVLLPFCMLCATRAVMQSQRKAIISAVWQAPQRVEKQNPTKWWWPTIFLGVTTSQAGVCRRTKIHPLPSDWMWLVSLVLMFFSCGTGWHATGAPPPEWVTGAVVFFFGDAILQFCNADMLNA